MTSCTITRSAWPALRCRAHRGAISGRPSRPSEQRAIAAVLDAIDEAIERTEEVIAATERLRDALLHELLTRGLPGRHSEWADVPGLGTVPACWDVVRLGMLSMCGLDRWTPEMPHSNNSCHRPG